MGIITKPENVVYGTDNFCFAAGKTPKNLYLTISGMYLNPFYTGEIHYCPNGTYVVRQYGQYDWANNPQITNHPDVEVALRPDLTIIWYNWGESIPFYVITSELCKWAGNNEQVYHPIWLGGSYILLARD